MNQCKPVVDPKALGAKLRERRKSLGITITKIAEIASVNVGQLSRLENGHMKRHGKNLQKLLASLDKLEEASSHAKALGLVDRFAVVIERSNRHVLAAAAFVDALEQL